MGAMKRLGLFLLTNLLVVLTLSVIIQLTGINIQNYGGLLILCAVFGFGGAFVSLLLSKQIAKWSYKIQLLDNSNATGRLAVLYDNIEKMAQHIGLKTPQVGIYNSREVNAFATGASANNSLIAFSSALIDRLDDEELAAVAGHELSHIANGDMVTMTLLTGVANTFVMFFARVLAYAISTADRDRNGGLGSLGYFMMVFLLENILMLLAYIPISAFSRWREYDADGGAAGLISPSAMINALTKLDRNYVPETKKDSFAMAKINNRHRVSLFATHPSIEARIARLQRLM